MPEVIRDLLNEELFKMCQNDVSNFPLFEAENPRKNLEKIGRGQGTFKGWQ